LTEATASAPGRVNLIGEHTDYNAGFVLPIATPQQTTVTITRRDDRVVTARSASIAGDAGAARFTLGEEQRQGGWIDYVQGVTAALQPSGRPIGGFDARIVSDVPLGAGLSSSASLEIALVRAIAALFGLTIDPIDAARIGHAAETGFVGVPVGMMDQMAASLASRDAALFLDTRSLTYERVRLPAAAQLVVIDSGIKHEHAGGEYRTRRAECEAAARLLGVEALRDADLARLTATPLPAPLDRRARHVVTENARVLRMCEALRADDLDEAGALMIASHASMRDDFDVSIPPIDALVDVACRERDVFGARLTGGGFGGCIVALARNGCGARAGNAIVAAYARSGGRGTLLIP
jgi:galactokinase